MFRVRIRPSCRCGLEPTPDSDPESNSDSDSDSDSDSSESVVADRNRPPVRPPDPSNFAGAGSTTASGPARGPTAPALARALLPVLVPAVATWRRRSSINAVATLGLSNADGAAASALPTAVARVLSARLDDPPAPISF